MQSYTETICQYRTCGEPWNTQGQKSKHFLPVIWYVFDVGKRILVRQCFGVLKTVSAT